MAEDSDPIIQLVAHGRAIIDSERAAFDALIERRADAGDSHERRQRLESRLGELVAECYAKVPSAAVQIDFIHAAIEPFEVACRNLLHWESHVPAGDAQQDEAFITSGSKLPTFEERWLADVDRY